MTSSPRLPSAADNRPLRFDEFYERLNQCVFLSATPSQYELSVSTQVVEQVVKTVKLDNLVPPILFPLGKAEIPENYLKLLRGALAPGRRV